MDRTPTLQALAVYAHDHLADESSGFDDSVSSSLGVVAAAYATEPDPEDVCGHASSTLCERLEQEGHEVDREDVGEFVRETVTYLQAVYPDGDTLQEEEEQRLLSQLFHAHLVQAHVAARGL